MLVPYRKRSNFPTLDADFNRLFSSFGFPNVCFEPSSAEESSTAAWTPAVDIKEEASKILVTADVPGVDPSEIELTVEDGYLTIKGERIEESAEEREGFKRIERSRGSFLRRLALPDSVDIEGISAKGKNGVLEISIPKQESKKAVKISVS